MKVIDLAQDSRGNQSPFEKLGTTRVLQSIGRGKILTVKVRRT
jgi:hypothetical protein